MRILLIVLAIAAAAPASAQETNGPLKQLADATEFLRGIITKDHAEYISECRGQWEVTVKTGARPKAPCRSVEALEARHRDRIARICERTLRDAQALAAPATSITRAQAGSITWALVRDKPWCLEQATYYGWGEK